MVLSHLNVRPPSQFPFLFQELIPEMFYLSEQFLNDNQYELGDDDEGNSVNTVTLPPWAKDHHHFLQVLSSVIRGGVIGICIATYFTLVTLVSFVESSFGSSLKLYLLFAPTP